MESTLHPQGVQAGYPGCANPTTSNTDDAPAEYSEPNRLAEEAAAKSTDDEQAKIVDQTELAPLGEEKVAADPGLVAQATATAKKAYEAVVGESK